MWFMIVTVLGPVWDWLPQITVALRFATALIGFAVAVPSLVRRVRRWRRKRR
ncbi:MAG: hypothetical protein ABW022_26070 [Actinoplanes sp.]